LPQAQGLLDRNAAWLFRDVDPLLEPAATRPKASPPSPNPPEPAETTPISAKKIEPKLTGVVFQDEPRPGPEVKKIKRSQTRPHYKDEPDPAIAGAKTNPSPAFAEPELSEKHSPDGRRRGTRRATNHRRCEIPKRTQWTPIRLKPPNGIDPPCVYLEYVQERGSSEPHFPPTIEGSSTLQENGNWLPALNQTITLI
jgi:hypothetical protein